jgi:hypothetical protein
VQALAVMDGRLVAAFGNNMQMMELRGSSLRMISFFHAQLLITSVATIKNFILLGDVHKGLTFVHADKKANYTALTQLSKVHILSASSPIAPHVQQSGKFLFTVVEKQVLSSSLKLGISVSDVYPCRTTMMWMWKLRSSL